MMRVRLPRSLAAAVALILLSGIMVGIIYYSYNQAATLFQDLPKYADKIREQVRTFDSRRKTFTFFPQIRALKEAFKAVPIGERCSRAALVQSARSSGLVPFSRLFHAQSQDHGAPRSATVMLFPMESRHTAYVTLGLFRRFRLHGRGFIDFIGAVSTAAFWMLNVPFFYFGFASGFFSLACYLGVAVAMAPDQWT